MSLTPRKAASLLGAAALVVTATTGAGWAAELLVIRRGWPVERYGQFVAEALIAALLPAQGT